MLQRLPLHGMARGGAVLVFLVSLGVVVCDMVLVDVGMLPGEGRVAWRGGCGGCVGFSCTARKLAS